MSAEPLFSDRHAAGVALAASLSRWANRRDVVVLGMARGGVAVAAPVAHALSAPLDTFVCRKLGVPGIVEVAFGAIAEGCAHAVLDAVHDFIGLPSDLVASVIARERREIARRVRCYRNDQPVADVAGRTVILVDDGLSSGATLRVAALALRHRNPARLMTAVPVASRHGLRDVAAHVDDVITLEVPERLGMVSDWYREYTPVSDNCVRALLCRHGDAETRNGELPPHDVERLVAIPTGDAEPVTAIAADLGGPAHAGTARGLVILAHGGGSSRGSYRNRYLAARFRHAGWATLRVDLLGACERAADAGGAVRFDIALLTRRLQAAAEWCIAQRVPGADRLVLCGASTGAAAALRAAAMLGPRVAGVVSRAGRIDLAADCLAQVRTPTLLIVGGADLDTLQRNSEYRRQLRATVTLQVVNGAGHSFEEPGALGAVGEVVTGWLGQQDQLALRHRNRSAMRIRLIGHWATAFPQRTF
jgi:putative phosphoribosyl transferase